VSDIGTALGSKERGQPAPIVAAGVTYFILARLGLLTTAASTHVAAVWAPGGFLLGVLGFFVAESKPLGEIDLARPAAVAV
jgi:hypothetical protein